MEQDGVPGAVQISPDGGTEPRWSPDGRTLYYREGTSLVAAELGPGPGIGVQNRTTLFPGDDHYLSPGSAQYDVHPDGDHFLVVRVLEAQEAAPEEMVVVVNWFREMEERMRRAGGG